MQRIGYIAVSIAATWLTGCSGNHAALNPAGPRAQRLAELMILFCSVGAVVYVATIASLLWAMMHRRPESPAQGGAAAQVAERKARRNIGAAVGLTVITLISLGLADFFVQRSLAAHPPDALRIVVTGHQYWWEVEYDDPQPSRRLRTANELHIPVHRPVELILRSRDVIHSFWVPNLMGKKDLIPGRTNTELLVADRPGLFRGQCAEFCGLQHAQMRLLVRAEPAAQFERWKQAQLVPARAPSTANETRGQQVFMASSCVLCHSIQGTGAAARVGPDLTHVASRRTLAAGALPNTPTDLASWVRAPQRLKPGARMPPTALPADELAALVSYLESLQ